MEKRKWMEGMYQWWPLCGKSKNEGCTHAPGLGVGCHVKIGTGCGEGNNFIQIVRCETSKWKQP